MIAIIDYDAGNLKSVEKALIALGEEVIVSRDSTDYPLQIPAQASLLHGADLLSVYKERVT